MSLISATVRRWILVKGGGEDHAGFCFVPRGNSRRLGFGVDDAQLRRRIEDAKVDDCVM